MEPVKVCTFNMRMDTVSDGKNMFPCRSMYIRDAIHRESPDIVGFQEVRPHMLDWLKNSFPEYYTVGAGRGSDYKDEANPVMFKKDKFDFIGYDMFWLSKTPFTPGLKYDEKSGCPRICVVITLKTNDNPSPFRVYNTHLDHVSEEARVNGMKVILDRMDLDDKRMTVPNLLMGDMNAFPDSETIQSILNCKSRTFKELTSDIPVSFTFYGTRAAKIDYIFASGNLHGSDAKIWDECHDGVYLTDHYPVRENVDFE